MVGIRSSNPQTPPFFMMSSDRDSSPGPGARNPGPRREGALVPGVLSSSSCDGPPVVLTACTTGENVSANIGTGTVGRDTSAQPVREDPMEPSPERETAPTDEATLTCWDTASPLPQRKKKEKSWMTEEDFEEMKNLFVSLGYSREFIERNSSEVREEVEFTDSKEKKEKIDERKKPRIIKDEIIATKTKKEDKSEERKIEKEEGLTRRDSERTLERLDEDSDCSFSSSSKRRRINNKKSGSIQGIPLSPDPFDFRTSAVVTGDAVQDVPVQVEMRAGTSFDLSPVLGPPKPKYPHSIVIDSDDDEFTSDKEREMINTLLDRQRQIAMDRDKMMNRAKARKEKRRRVDQVKTQIDSQKLQEQIMETDSRPPTPSIQDTQESEDYSDQHRRFATVKVQTLGDRLINWLKEIDEMRGKSRNLQGGISGAMKRNIRLSILAVQDIVTRSDQQGDSSYLRSMNAEITAELRQTNRDKDRLKIEVERLKKEKEKIMREKEILLYEKEALLKERKEFEWKKPYPPETRRMVYETDASEMSTDTGSMLPPAGVPSKSKGPMMPTMMTMNSREQRAVSDATQLELELTQKINSFIEMRKVVRKEKQEIITASGMASNIQNKREKHIQRKKEETRQTDNEEGWNLVVGRKKKTKIKTNEIIQGQRNRQTAKTRVDVSRPGNRRVPKTAAVTVKVDTQTTSYADVIRKARESISLKDLGIEEPKLRKARGGALIIELPGEEAHSQADLLAHKLAGVLAGSAVISRPNIKGELRIIGIEDSVTTEDLKTRLAVLTSGCPSDFECSPISAMRNGMGIAWVKCKLETAIKLASMKIQLGWSVVRVELLKARPLQCYRCWDIGHVKSECRSDIDRSTTCYKCGQIGHLARGCENTPNCAVCSQAGLESSHRMGGALCRMRSIKKILEDRRRTLINRVLEKGKKIDRELEQRKKTETRGVKGRPEVAGFSCDPGFESCSDGNLPPPAQS